MLSAVFGVGVFLAMGAVTVAVGDSDAYAQNRPTGGGWETHEPVTKGRAPSTPAIRSAVPNHVAPWRCGGIFHRPC